MTVPWNKTEWKIKLVKSWVSLSFARFLYLPSLSALSPRRGSFPPCVPAFSPWGDNCATCTKQDDPRLILCAEGEIDFYAQVKGDRLQFHKARFGEANCINVLQKGDDRKVYE